MKSLLLIPLTPIPREYFAQLQSLNVHPYRERSVGGGVEWTAYRLSEPVCATVIAFDEFLGDIKAVLETGNGRGDNVDNR
jgi:hypothetical protein